MSEGRPYSLPSSEPIPVRKAVDKFFPAGGIKVATLMAAIRAGELGFEKIGRAYFVTEADIMEWRKQCRQKRREPVSISGIAKVENPSGSSETDRNRLAQALAKNISQKLRYRLPTTCRPDFGLTQDNVTLLKSLLPKS